MATAHRATVVDVRPIGRAGRMLTLELPAEPIGFVGGQYVIVDSGRTLPTGKAAKRAYSIVSTDADQGHAELIVKRISADAGGLASDFLHGVGPGDGFSFSGPWGKFVAGAPPAHGTLVFATDTGITAALGLLAGRDVAARAATTHVVWLADDSFVPAAFVAERLAGRCASLHIERSAAALGIARGLVAEHRLDAAYLSGDGLVLRPLRDELLAAGVADAAIRVETFFHHAERKAA